MGYVSSQECIFFSSPNCECVLSYSESQAWYAGMEDGFFFVALAKFSISYVSGFFSGLVIHMYIFFYLFTYIHTVQYNIVIEVYDIGDNLYFYLIHPM